MDLATYQARAAETDRTDANYDNTVQRDVVVALLGIAGELGTLATTYKKYLRDGKDYTLHNDHVAEELGDLLWYCATLATKFGLDLQDIAQKNLKKVDSRWAPPPELLPSAYDAGYPDGQRFPRHLTIDFSEEEIAGRKKAVMVMNGARLGNELTDNTDEPDDYRFHDAFHVAFLTVLGWSPVLRGLMKRKRKENKTVDENEDGGRATVIEEGIAALVFDYGIDHGSLSDVRTIDYDLIRTIQSMTRRLEVKHEPGARWQSAVLQGWELFRQLQDHRGGRVTCDLDSRTIKFVPPGDY